MNQKDRKILFSKILIYIFAAALALLDAVCLIVGTSPDSTLHSLLLHSVTEERVFQLIICTYLCSIPGYNLLWQLHKLLSNLQKGLVFTETNVRLMGIVSTCCYCAGIICMVFVLQGMLPLLVVTIAAWFVALIVQIVQDAFRQAITMKDELDFTV